MTSDIATDHITDDYMRARIHGARKYSLVVLRPTPALFEQSSAPIIWEHGRRNMALQAAGTMPIVCPVGDDAISGIAIFDVAADEADGSCQTILACGRGSSSSTCTSAAVFPAMLCRIEVATPACARGSLTRRSDER